MHVENNIANEFNKFSVNYTADMIGCVPHYLDLLTSFTKNLPQKFIPQNILDLGCGNGNVTSEILKMFPASNFTLLDASEEMIRICKERFKAYSIEYITSYFKDYVLKENEYEMIVAGFSLHHCTSEEKKILFQHIYNSLKKGGIFGFSDLMINKNSPLHSKLLKEWKTFVYKTYPDGEKWNWLMEHYGEFDKPDDFKSQIAWLHESGFNDVFKITKRGNWIHIRAVK